MKEYKTIHSRNVPTRLPIATSLLFILALDYWGAPEWLWGAVILLLLIWFSVALYCIYKEKRIDIFEDTETNDNVEVRKKSFNEKVAERINKGPIP